MKCYCLLNLKMVVMKFHIAYSFGLDGKHLVNKETAKIFLELNRMGKGQMDLRRLTKQEMLQGQLSGEEQNDPDKCHHH